MMLSSHLLMLLVELPVRLHTIENANSKIIIVSTLLNMSLYCEIQFISALERLILVYCCHFCKVIKKKAKKKSLVRRGWFSPEFSLELSSSWGSALKCAHFLLCLYGVSGRWCQSSVRLWVLKGAELCLALCACNQSSLGSAPVLWNTLLLKWERTGQGGERAISISLLVDNLPLHNVSIHTFLF